MVREGEGIRVQGRPPRRPQLKQRPPLARLIALGTPGPGPLPFPFSSRAVGPRTNNHKAGQRPDRGLMRVAHLGSPRAARGPAANSAPAPDCHAGGRQPSRDQVQRTWGG